MTIIVHVSPVSYRISLQGRVHNLLSLSNLIGWGHCPFVGCLEVWPNMVELILFWLFFYIHKFIVILNVLVTRIFLFKWMVFFVRVYRPHLLTLIHGGIIRDLLYLWFCFQHLFSGFIHLNNLLIVSFRINLFFL